jgi:hypothetical protein
LLTLLAGSVLICSAICNAQSPAAPPRPAQPASDSTLESGEAVIVLARGAGYWDMAPVYRLMIYADGSVAYIGSKNVKTKGFAKGRISREDVQRLVKEFENVNYFALLDEYSEKGGCPFYMWDASNASTVLNSGGKKKSVFHDLGCLADSKSFASFPRGLAELENLIDEIVKSDQWIK